jgi:hypothetical protein
MSAELEHHWLMHNDTAAQTQQMRAAMIELLDVVSQDRPGPWILSRRIDAKFAHAALLSRATFNDDARDAAWALRRAELQIAACKSLLLS